MTTKFRVIIGCLSLLFAGICTSLLLMSFQKDWIMLLAVILFSIIYAKFLKSEEIVQSIRARFSQRMLSIVAIILIFLGLSLLPDSLGALINEQTKILTYTISFICWMSGMLILDIRFNK